MQVRLTIRFAILICTGLLYLGGMTATADVLSIDNLTKLPVEEQHGHHHHSGFEHAVSQQNLLGLERDAKSLLPVSSLSALNPRVLKICAIRVQFKYEEPDDPNTTGRGHFDFRDYDTFVAEERHAVDPAPHNRRYFGKHIEALHNYWYTVSGGKVILTGDVYPLIDDSVYTLDQTMGFYGSQEPANGLGQFFYDALRLADKDDDINWNEYDVFMVFHAGSDRQNDLGFPETSSDLFTGFLIMGAPVPVEDSTIGILEGIVMPETVSQDNRANALNAVMAHEFGHQLGLVDLYDTRTFTTFIGDYSLMDNNGFGTGVDLGFERTRTILGTMPIYPDAWSRAYLGFVDIEVIEPGQNFPLKAAELDPGPDKVYKIPISENEYFLIENRQTDLDGDGANLKADIDTAGGNIPTGVILGPAPGFVPPGQSAPLTREYDFLIPGSGMVIWHVDETVAWDDYDADGLNNFYDNDLQWYYYDLVDTVNTWKFRPFLRLIEADGIIDFGGNYYTNFGRPEDLFHAGNNNQFGPNTNPSTRSNTGAYTGIDIYDITASDTLMYFDYEHEIKLAGWPRHTDSSMYPPVLYDVDGDQVDEVFVSGQRYILAFKANGDFLFEPTTGSYIISSRRALPPGPLSDPIHTDTLRAIGMVDSGDVITTPPTVADLDGDGVAEVAVGSEQGKIYLWSLSDSDGDGFVEKLAEIEFSAYEISADLIVADADNVNPGLEIVAGNIEGEVAFFDASGSELNKISGIGPVRQIVSTADFSSAWALVSAEGIPGLYELVNVNNPSVTSELGSDILGISAGTVDTIGTKVVTAVSRDGRVYIYRDESGQLVDYNMINPVLTGKTFSSRPVLYPALENYSRSQIYICGDNMFYGYHLNGTPLENFPLEVDRHEPAGHITASPVIVDINNDRYLDFILGTAEGELFMLNENAEILSNSPLATPLSVSNSAAFSTKSHRGTGFGNLYLNTDDGLIYGFLFPAYDFGSLELYSQYGGASHHRGYFEGTMKASQAEKGFLAYSYNYPNPAEDFTTIRFETSESADVNLRFYDLSGRLIYEHEMRVSGAMPSEFVWNTEEVPPGVYHCRLEVNSDGGSDINMFNIAVVK
ncbi:MAG: T9SS type A sorting domain-containing protein [candidate division Zixibacteria bacterium]|nr:T9SS type A sorting domain-containing protein [candidate division Zixibacteria bacterium]